MFNLINKLPGLLVVLFIGSLAFGLHLYLGSSATILALVLGFLLSNFISIPARFDAGIAWVECHGLAAAVALLGVQLNWTVLVQINPLSFGFIVTSIAVTFIVTWLVAKWLKVNGTAACLLASGQAICGSAAVMAASKVTLAPNQAQTGLIVAVINFLGFLGVFMTVWLVQFLVSDNPTASGFLMGNTLQSMGHVVAAGFSVSDPVGHGAVLIKMCRILLLVPTLLVMVIVVNHSSQKVEPHTDQVVTKTSKVKWAHWVPWFIWAFIVLMVLNNLQLIPKPTQILLSQFSYGLFVMAMVAIGLSIKLRHIWQHGVKLLLLGGIVFLVQIGLTVLLVSYIELVNF